jgi:hypothetical protein
MIGALKDKQEEMILVTEKAEALKVEREMILLKEKMKKMKMRQKKIKMMKALIKIMKLGVKKMVIMSHHHHHHSLMHSISATGHKNSTATCLNLKLLKRQKK